MRLNNYNYKQCLSRLKDNEDFIFFLSYHRLIHVEGTAFGKNELETYKKLAVKEHIQGILNDVKNPEKVDELVYAPRETLDNSQY